MVLILAQPDTNIISLGPLYFSSLLESIFLDSLPSETLRPSSTLSIKLSSNGPIYSSSLKLWLISLISFSTMILGSSISIKFLKN